MSRPPVTRGKRLAALVSGTTIILGLGVFAPATAAVAAPAPAPASPNLLFEETFENGTGAEVTSLTGYTGAQGATFTADPFWLNAAACNGLVLQEGSDWSGAGAACATPDSRDRLMELADVLGDGNQGNHVVAAYTDANGPADQTLLAKTIDSGINLTAGRFYVASIDIAEANCFASVNSTISFGLVLPSGEVMIDGDPAVACAQGQSTVVDGREVKYGTFSSAGFRSPESGSAEYVARNLLTGGGGNDFAYDNLRFFDATPTLHKSFAADTVEVGQPVRMDLTVVNTTELSEKTGWSFTDDLPANMTIAAEPNVTTDCSAADVTAEAGASTLEVSNGSIATDVASCTISADVVLGAGGDFTNVISGAAGLDGTPSATIRALVPSLQLTKTVDPEALTADNRQATYTFTVLNDGDVDLHDVVVADPGPIGGKGTLGPIDCDGVTDLAVGDQFVCTAVYTAAIEDITGAALTNQATATGVSPAGTQVEADSRVELPTVEPKPELTLVKSADTAIATKVGQVITYSFAVTNTGNVTIDDVEVTEGSFSGAGKLGDVVCPAAADSLAPAQLVTCTAAYTVVAADLTGKAITNTATAAGIGPNGPVASAESTATVKTVAPAATLANTGVDAAQLLAGGVLAFLMLGGGAFLIARRRQLS